MYTVMKEIPVEIQRKKNKLINNHWNIYFDVKVTVTAWYHQKEKLMHGQQLVNLYKLPYGVVPVSLREMTRRIFPLRKAS